MTNVTPQRRMAADILGIGQNKVYIDPDQVGDVATAVTRQDVRNLIKQGTIQKREDQGTSRGRARHTQEQKKKGRKQSHGSRKGRKTARKSAKEEWMQKIRGLRSELKQLRDNDTITASQYRHLYRMAKGNAFRNKKHMQIYMEKEMGINPGNGEQ